MNPVSVLPIPSPDGPNDKPTPGAVTPLTADDLAALTTSEVADELTTWAGRVAAGEALLLAYIGEFDRRKGWTGIGVLSCAHWLSWRVGMSLKTATDRVRVARVLLTLPLTSAAFAAGELSFTQVRAITRMASPEDEAEYISIARHATGGQLERLARGIHRARKLGEKAAAKAKGQQPPPSPPQFTVTYEDDGDLRITIRVSAEDGAVVLAALEAARSDQDSEQTPASAEAAPGATAGEGFQRLCRIYLQQRAHLHPDRARRDRARLTVQVDPLSGWARLPDGELLTPGVAGATGLTFPRGTVLRGMKRSDLTRFDAGRRSRKAGQALRELLGVLDGERCRFPSCSRRRRLHAHHIIFWGDKGRTDLANLVLLCTRHHTLVHEEGFRLVLHPTSRRLTVTTRQGTSVPHRQPLPWRPVSELDPNQRIDSATLPPTVHDRLDLHYAVSVLLQHAA
jgi:hypothetical protein